MEKVAFRYLTQEEVMGLGISDNEIIDVVEGALASHGKKFVENPPKPGIHTRHMTFIHAMPAWIKDKDVCGIKWVCGYPENYKYNLPQIAGLLILNDPETGMPIALMDCRWITAVRTAAVTAVTAKYCVRQDAEVVTIIGAGVQGKMNAKMLQKVVPNLKLVQVYDIKEQVMQTYIEQMSPKLRIEVKGINNLEKAVKESDVVLTATQKLENPIVRSEWLKPGVMGFGLESSRAWHGNALLAMDKFITDDWEQTKYYQSHNGAFVDGLPKLYAQLGEVVIGEKPGRENDSEKIMAINHGMALIDMALADEIYRRAMAKDVGIDLTLMEQDNLI
ncbi:MAG: ornithine cyclodeaminase family protein [Peptococcales bacterium]